MKRLRDDSLLFARIRPAAQSVEGLRRDEQAVGHAAGFKEGRCEGYRDGLNQALLRAMFIGSLQETPGWKDCAKRIIESVSGLMLEADDA